MAGRDDATDDDGTGYTGGASDGLDLERRGKPVLQRLFASCDGDAVGTVHRAWAVTVLVMVVFFAVSVMEGEVEFWGACVTNSHAFILLILTLHCHWISLPVG